MRIYTFAVAMAFSGALFAADPGLVSLAMPDSQFMAGVNVAQLMLSPLGQYLLTQTGQLPDADLQKLMDAAGFDPRRDLREILVSSSGLTGSDAGIILARGAFDVPKIVEAAQAAGETIETYHGVPVVTEPKDDALAFPDSTLAIAGNAAVVRAAIDRMPAPAALSSTLAAQVNQLSTSEDAWFISLAPLSKLQPSGPAALLNKVQQASGGVKFGANAVVTLQAVSPTDQDAAALAAVLKSLPGLAQMGGSNGDLASVMALLQSLSVTAEGQITKISWSVPEAQIEQMIASGAAGVSSRSAEHVPAPAVEQSAQPSTGVVPERVRISGNVQERKLLQHPPPVYPPLALQARISGVVRLNAIIGKDGAVQNITVVSGHPLLVAPALDAVKQWTYRPTLLNGQPVEVVTQVDVNFSLSQ